MHVIMIEAAVSLMPPGVTEATIVADASGLGVRQMSPSLMKVRHAASAPADHKAMACHVVPTTMLCRSASWPDACIGGAGPRRGCCNCW